MTLKDYRDYDISGATPLARDAFERALAFFQSWRSGTEAQLAIALLDAPSFTMAHLLKAYVWLCGRDAARWRLARSAYAQASACPANARERLHLAAIGAALADDLEALKTLLGTLLQQYPRDVLALQIAHAFDYVTGDIARMSDRVPAVLWAWSKDVPGYAAVLAMQAFSLVECGHHQSAADAALRALEINPFDARAHHAMAHVYEMTEDPNAGARWMRDRLSFWAEDTVVATHCWWHWALHCLAQGELDEALGLYDQRVRAGHSSEVADMIDASALLWRLELLGADTGGRWLELASAWAQHITDGFCSFNDVHAMLALVGAQDWGQASRLESELARCQHFATRHSETTRLVGLPACRGIIAFGRGDYARAIELLGAIPAFARRIGGSHAQRDVLYLTLLEAVQRIRRSQLRIAA
jgi:tetratricopeptide (TPR) repeat protein